MVTVSQQLSVSKALCGAEEWEGEGHVLKTAAHKPLPVLQCTEPWLWLWPMYIQATWRVRAVRMPCVL
jgi:hypothetical protein